MERPSWVWKARRQATHSVAPQMKASVTALTSEHLAPEDLGRVHGG